MGSMSRRANIILAGSLIGATALIFLTDLLTMLGFAHGMLYVIVILIASISGHRGLIITMSGLAVALIALGYFVAPQAPEAFPTEYVIANRAVSALIVLTICALAVTRVHIMRDRNETESRLARRLTTTLESITDGFVLLDRDWRFTFANSRAEALLECSEEDLLGRSIWEAFPQTMGTELESKYRQAIESGKSVQLKYHDQVLERWFSITAYPSDEGLAVYFQDITERVSIEEQLRQSQRLEAVGQLTGGIAHDFNNLLTVLLGNAELLREDLPDDHPLKDVAGTMVQAAQRGSELTQRLLAFARRQALNPRPTDVNRLVAHMDDLLRRALGDHVEIELSRGGGLWLAMVDEAQLESALLNLCLNARDAMPRGGRLTIETANVRLDQDYAEQHGETRPGQYVMLAVSDTGKGIDPEHLDKVFEPFFTTKAKGKGTGLGLSMIYGFIKQSEGHVNIYSEPGEGTTIRMYLPRAREDIRPPETTAASNPKSLRS